MKTQLNDRERMVILGARLIRRTWLSSEVATRDELTQLLSAALRLAMFGDIARRLEEAPANG